MIKLLSECVYLGVISVDNIQLSVLGANNIITFFFTLKID